MELRSAPVPPPRRVLHIALSIGETNATYNEHCLPAAAERDIAICTFFKATVTPPERIALFEGDGSLKGFRSALKAAFCERRYDVVHAHSPHVALLFLAATRLLRVGCATPAIVTVHDSYPNYKRRNRLLFLPVFATYSRIVCCSESSFDSFPAPYRQLAGRRLGFVRNGLDIERVDRISAMADRIPNRADGFRVVAISRLVDVKNPFTVLRAFEQGAGQADRLTLVGEGPLRASLAETCERAGMAGRIALTGLLPREVVFRHLLSADLFVSASRGEGLPVAVLEAMACRCPVVLSDIPPHREIAAGLDCVSLVDPEDVGGFARQIARYRAMTAVERQSIGLECRAVVERRFSLRAMHAAYEDVYASVVSDGQPGAVRSGVVHAG